MMGSTDDETTARTLPSPLRPGPSGLSRRRVSEIQRARILVSAIEVVEEAGYSGMTVARVIGRAKVSRKTFYDLFEDRQHCFLEALEQTIARIRERMQTAYARESSWRDGLRAGLVGLLGFLDEEPALARICLIEAQVAGAKVLERRARIFGELAEIVDRGRAVTSAVREPPEITAEALVGAVFAVLQTRLFEQSDRPFMDLLGPSMSMILLPYLGPRAAYAELARPAGESE